MSGPKHISFSDIEPRPQAESDIPPAPRPQGETSPPNAGGPLSYATRFTAQRFHPVILIGSSAAGKTVLLLSLLAYFKDGPNGRGLSVAFGDDLFKATERPLQADSKRYFEQSVAQYIRGESQGATRIETPMFIPAMVYNEAVPGLKFAFMESDGEKYQSREKPGEDFFPAFDPQLAALLTQYSDGISFIWIVPHVPQTVPGSVRDLQRDYDPEILKREARESLENAFKQYTALRSRNAGRDTHMLLVTKWDTYEPRTLANDIRTNLDRTHDVAISHEVESFLDETYSGVYGVFESLRSPRANKVVFRYSAGLFNDRNKAGANIEDLLRTYPRDVWNWLYDGMRTGHDWDLEPGPLIPPPVRKGPSLLERWEQLVTKIIG